ncbi:hypothetical protein [Dyadobacter tibetensis]|uniref:hypothetical protein n=1 Tax=Dyadobacter tibetensis TaxID=1211851 RepID=UPI0004AD5EFD|nr:hypothetical protein [Dyadobacter tibetensis]
MALIMDFDAYLLQKKINSHTFRMSDPDRYGEWAHIFVSMHPDSFTAQKKFLINETRRRYPLEPEA